MFKTRTKPLLLSLFALIGVLISPMSSAGVFSVTPVRIYMTTKDRAVAVTVNNDGDEELVMQADLYLWSQNANGDDELTLTEDLFLSPPIIKLAPKSRQVVRLARLTPANAAQQLTYRMIAREIPEARPAKEDLQLQIALAFSMPVFITPPNAKAILDCSVEKAPVTGLSVLCENSGNAHSHPVQLKVLNAEGKQIAIEETGSYLLAGAKKRYPLKLQEGAVIAGKMSLEVTLDDANVQKFDVTNFENAVKAP